MFQLLEHQRLMYVFKFFLDLVTRVVIDLIRRKVDIKDFKSMSCMFTDRIIMTCLGMKCTFHILFYMATYYFIVTKSMVGILLPIDIISPSRPILLEITKSKRNKVDICYTQFE